MPCAHSHGKPRETMRPTSTYGKSRPKIFNSGQIPAGINSWPSHVHPGTQTVSDPLHVSELDDFRSKFNAIRAGINADSQPSEEPDFEEELETQLIGQHDCELTLGGDATPNQSADDSD